jgi:hypothetical protein
LECCKVEALSSKRERKNKQTRITVFFPATVRKDEQLLQSAMEQVSELI